METYSTPSLPGHLHETYRRYKEDTDTIATWLVQTVQLRRGRQTLAGECGKEISLSVASFVHLAREIATFHDPPVSVPQQFVETTQRVVKAREKCTKWFQGAVSTDDSRRSDTSHLHFTDALRHMLAILTLDSLPTQVVPAARNAMSQKLPRCPHPPRQIRHDNLFEALTEAKDTANADAGETSIVAATKRNGPDVSRARVRASPSSDEKLFKYFCLLDDLSSIRKFILGQWRQYKKGQQALISASLLSIHALRIVKQLESAFFTSGRHGEGFQSTFVDFFYRSACEQRGQTFSCEWGPEYDHRALFVPAMSDVADLLMLPSWYLLEKNLDISRRRLECGSADADVSAVPVTVKRAWVEEGGCARDQFVQDGVIIDELFQSTSSMLSLEEMWYEHFVCDLVDLLNRPRQAPPLSLVFATRLFVDVQRTLRDEGLVQGVTQLITTVRDSKRWCERNLASHIDFTNLGAAHERLREARVFSLAIEELLRQQDFKRVLARWPVWCGLFSFMVRMKVHHAGQAASYASYLTVTAAHVYNMLQQEKVLQTRWHDMDFFIRAHTVESVFAGDLPRSRCQYIVRWKIVHGVSLVRAARRKSVPKLGRTMTFVEHQIPILKELFELMRHHDQSEKLELMLVLLRSCKAGTTIPRDIALLRKAGRRLGRLSGEDMLIGLERVLRDELPQMYFDPFGLCRSCWALNHAVGIEMGIDTSQEAALFMAINPTSSQLQNIGRVFEEHLVGHIGASGVAAVQREIPGFDVPPIDWGFRTESHERLTSH